MALVSKPAAKAELLAVTIHALPVPGLAFATSMTLSPEVSRLTEIPAARIRDFASAPVRLTRSRPGMAMRCTSLPGSTMSVSLYVRVSSATETTAVRWTPRSPGTVTG